MLRNPLSGHVVEFALLAPWALFFCLVMADLILITIHRFRLDALCAETARALAQSPAASVEEMRNVASSHLAFLPAVDLTVEMRDLSAKPVPPPRETRRIEIIEVTMRRQVRPRFLLLRLWTGEPTFLLIAHAREVREIA